MNVAIERYRSRHQDPLLERAGQYLNDLTCGSFTGLAVDFDEANRRVLRAVLEPAPPTTSTSPA